MVLNTAGRLLGTGLLALAAGAGHAGADEDRDLTGPSPEFLANMPQHAFDPAAQAPAPDYAQAANWASLPSLDDPADRVPAGLDDAVVQGQAPVDVFFVHPTGYFGSRSWTSPMKADSATAANTDWVMAHQASVFNGCCNVYAPRYRQASIYAYVQPPDRRDAVLDFAYQDVARAFAYYLREFNDGRPFILAAHSQGTHHARRLLAEQIDPTELHERLVVAYLLGSTVLPVTQDWLDSLQHVKTCRSPKDLGCLVHWDTLAEGGQPKPYQAQSLCTNPLSWRVDEQRAPASQHRGFVELASEFLVRFGDASDEPYSAPPPSLTAPLPARTWAQCRDGALYVARQPDAAFVLPRQQARGTYHILDYSLFYVDIRDNARLRAQQFLARR